MGERIGKGSFGEVFRASWRATEVLMSRLFVFVYILYVRMCVCALVYVCKVIISPYQRILLRHFLRCSVRACVRLFASVSLCAWCVHLGREFLENAFFLWCLRAFVTLLNKMHFELLFFIIVIGGC